MIRKMRFAVLFCAALAITTPATAFAETYYATADLNIREEPEGKKIGMYKKNEAVEVLGYEKNWAKTDKGYVYTPYLSEEPNGRTKKIIDIQKRTAKTGQGFEQKVLDFSDEYDEAEKKYKSDKILVTESEHSTGTGKYLLTHVVIKKPSQIKYILSNDDWGGVREYPTAVAERTGAVVVTNGSYFSYDTGNPACAGVFISNGEIMQEGETNGREVCLTKDGEVFSPEAGISAAELLEDGVLSNWGTADPLLIADGENKDLSTTTHNYPYPRTAIGMVEPGEYYIVTAGMSNYNGGLEYAELQEIFDLLGCTYARSLDGGGSASLVIEGDLLNTPAAGEERPVVDFLAFTE